MFQSVLGMLAAVAWCRCGDVEERLEKQLGKSVVSSCCTASFEFDSRLNRIYDPTDKIRLSSRYGYVYLLRNPVNNSIPASSVGRASDS